MKTLVFVSRVAFITNICMLVTFLMRYVDIIQSRDLQSTIIISGLLTSLIANMIAAVGVAFLIFTKQANRLRPAWLFTVNFLCFIFQLYFFLK